MGNALKTLLDFALSLRPPVQLSMRPFFLLLLLSPALGFLPPPPAAKASSSLHLELTDITTHPFGLLPALVEGAAVAFISTKILEAKVRIGGA